MYSWDARIGGLADGKRETWGKGERKGEEQREERREGRGKGREKERRERRRGEYKIVFIYTQRIGISTQIGEYRENGSH